MSKLVYICPRNRQPGEAFKQKIALIASRVLPDHIVAEPPRIIDSNGVIAGILNPHSSVQVKDASVCLGYIEESEGWHIPGSGRPEGSYAIFRADEGQVQILTDAVASRTVWYYQDDEFFIAATSQRAIILVLGSFEFNQSVIPWMLSTGSVGPIHGWDRRIKRLGGASTLTLDRATWAVATQTPIPAFHAQSGSDAEHTSRLKKVLDATFSHIKLDYTKWVLLLSGGFDSRGILCLLKDRAGLRTVTWGVKAALSEEFNDAHIAHALATHFNLPHVYFETDLVAEQVETVFQRYLTCGEGLCDHVSGYLDGFAIWKRLYEAGLRGIIRGDEGFGWVPVASALDVRLGLGLPLWSDFANLKKLSEFGLHEQDMPEELLQKEGESLEAWRDRLYHQFRIPVVLGALSDLKLSYVEIINPLLSNRILQTVRTLPDHLRTDKKLFKSIVRSVSPEIAFAKQQALADKEDILRTKPVVDFLKRELSDAQTEAVFPREFLDYVIANMAVEHGPPAQAKKPDVKSLLKAFLPKSIRSKLKRTVNRPKMDFNSLAFRTFLVAAMYGKLSADANLSASKYAVDGL